MSLANGNNLSSTEPPNGGFWRLLRADVRAKARWMYQREGGGAVVKTLLTDGTAAMVWYRLMQWAGRWRLAPLEMVFNKLNAICCNCIIGRGAEFGAGFVLVHSTGVVINGSVRGGRGVVIEHQVTIGAEGRRSPVIGDGVFIGAGAKVIGAVSVGDGARVGANAVVVKDVPAHCTVVGIPAKVVRRREGAAENLASLAEVGVGPRTDTNGHELLTTENTENTESTEKTMSAGGTPVPRG